MPTFMGGWKVPRVQVCTDVNELLSEQLQKVCLDLVGHLVIRRSLGLVEVNMGVLGILMCG